MKSMEVSKKPKLAEKIKKQSRHCAWRRADVKTQQNVDETYILLLQNVDRAHEIQKNLLHGAQPDGTITLTLYMAAFV